MRFGICLDGNLADVIAHNSYKAEVSRLLQCVRCKADNVKDEDGICPYILADDQLPVRCFGSWARDKLYYLQKYMNMFNTSMKNKWHYRAYVELFAGPGRGIVRNTSQIIKGSPLLAIEQSVPFTYHIFVDINKSAVEALEKRVKSLNPRADVKLINKDCNLSIDEIRKLLSISHLILAFYEVGCQ